MGDEVMMYVGDEVRMEDKVYKVNPTTAQKFASSIGTRYPAPANVFCSRKLEGGLNNFMAGRIALGTFPTDEEIRAKAREILGVEETAADDVHLLEKFKAIHGMNIQTSPHAGSTFSNEAELLAGLDNELAMSGGATDLSTMAMDFDMTSPTFPNTSTSSLVVPPMTSTAGSPSSYMSSKKGYVLDSEQTIEAMSIAKEYADLYRVHSATASPLRRKASKKLANSSGLNCRD